MIVRVSSRCLLRHGSAWLIAVLLGAVSAVAQVAVVTNTLDAGPGSLRAALAVAATQPGTTVTFAIPTSDPGFDGSTWRIAAQSGFTVNATGTVLDATTQTTFAGNTNPAGPEVVLDGLPSVPLQHDGLTLTASECVVRGLVIHQFFGAGLRLLPGTDACVIEGNYLGTDATGTLARPNARAVGLSASARGAAGIAVWDGSTWAPDPRTDRLIGHRIGGPTAATRNLISGNGRHGVILGPGPHRLEGNFIGTDRLGTTALPNAAHGVLVRGYATVTRNVISGNTEAGVYCDGAIGARLEGNLIGPDAAGTTALPNRQWGVFLGNASSRVEVGGPAPGAGNTISGNLLGGIRLSGSDNIVRGNLIGLAATGLAALGNQGPGIQVGGPGSHIIGRSYTTLAGPLLANTGNTISGNTGYGIFFTRSGGAAVADNVIGLGTDGRALGNHLGGIDLNGRGGRLDYCTIAGNGGPGVRFSYTLDVSTSSIRDNAGPPLAYSPGVSSLPPPTLQTVVLDTALRVTGSFRPYSTYEPAILTFFATPPGETFSAGDLAHCLGTVTFATPTAPVTSFTVEVPRPAPAGHLLTVLLTSSYLTSLPATNVPITATDSDGDSLPDAWELAHGLDPHDPTDAALDPDGDGYTHRDTCFTPAAGIALPMDVRLVGSDVRVTMPMLGATDTRSAPLRVEVTSDLAAGPWRTVLRWTLERGVGGFATPSGPQILSFIDTGGATAGRRFYRAVIDTP